MWLDMQKKRKIVWAGDCCVLNVHLKLSQQGAAEDWGEVLWYKSLELQEVLESSYLVREAIPQCRNTVLQIQHSKFYASKSTNNCEQYSEKYTVNSCLSLFSLVLLDLIKVTNENSDTKVCVW